jgi:dUTP pyrophosphatase
MESEPSPSMVKIVEPTQSRIDEMYVNQFCFDTIAQNFAVLKLAVSPSNPELLELYTSHVAKHNIAMEKSLFFNSGFDLFFPSETVFDKDFAAKFVDLNIKCEMLYCDKNIQLTLETDDGELENVSGASYSCGYYVYPRSSISKTPLMLANHVGIIDSGYRGNIMVAIRKFPSDKDDSLLDSYVVKSVNTPIHSLTPTSPFGVREYSTYVVEKHSRLFQICHSSLCPVFVVLVPESELNSSERGEGGFGSTGV